MGKAFLETQKTIQIFLIGLMIAQSAGFSNSADIYFSMSLSASSARDSFTSIGDVNNSKYYNDLFNGLENAKKSNFQKATIGYILSIIFLLTAFIEYLPGFVNNVDKLNKNGKGMGDMIINANFFSTGASFLYLFFISSVDPLSYIYSRGLMGNTVLIFSAIVVFGFVISCFWNCISNKNPTK